MTPPCSAYVYENKNQLVHNYNWCLSRLPYYEQLFLSFFISLTLSSISRVCAADKQNLVRDSIKGVAGNPATTTAMFLLSISRPNALLIKKKNMITRLTGWLSWMDIVNDFLGSNTLWTNNQEFDTKTKRP